MTTKISQNLLQAGQRLVYENILTATANNIDITGLTGIAHGGYTIDVDYYNTATNGASLFWFSGYLYFNTNYTNTNYDYTYSYRAGGIATSNAKGNSPYAWYTDQQGACKLRIDVSVVDNNGTKYITSSLYHHNPKVDQSEHGVSYRTAVTDLTDIRILGTGVSTSPFEIGTIIRVYRKL